MWSIDIAAPPEQVWQLISDPTRTPEWSPVCHTVEWVGDVREPVVGARFRGHNNLNGFRWRRECRVTEAIEPSVFAWSTYVKDKESTRWRYELSPTDSGGTRLVERYEIVSVPRWIRLMWRVPGALKKSDRDRERNLQASLARIKEIAEQS